MFYKMLENRLKTNQTLLCIGLDPDIDKLNDCGFKDSLFDFNKLIIDATYSKALAFKLQIAFYSSIAKEDELLKTIEYIKENYEDIPIILDAKRGDIGSTAEHYAKEAFVRYGVDAVTVNPYMGKDSIIPFLEYKNKGTIILAHNSNKSAYTQDEKFDEKPLYEHFLDNCLNGVKITPNICFVIGAQCLDSLKNMSNKFPNNWFLVPGVGKQGGKISDIANFTNKKESKLIINISRGLYSYCCSPDKISEYARDKSEYYFNEINKEFNL